jgi:uncharacterized protein (DUF3084 family)
METTDQAEGQSPEDRMMALLGDVEEDAPEPAEAQAEEEPESEAEPEQEAEAQPQPTKLKLKWNGEEVEKDLDEVVALAQQGHDYTQKTQKLADERRVIEEQSQAIKAQEKAFQEQTQLQRAFINEIAEVTALDKQIAQFQNVDWNALTDQDPVQAQKLFYQRTQLVDARNRMAQEIAQKHQTIQQQQHAQREAVIAKAKEALRRELPDWDEAKEAQAKEIAKSYGFKDEEFSSVIDARTMKMILDAGSYRKLQSNPVTQNKVAGKPPVVKPGSKDPNSAHKAQTQEIRNNLRKSGRMNDAARLIELTLK